jgi:hypothetical protein
MSTARPSAISSTAARYGVPPTRSGPKNIRAQDHHGKDTSMGSAPLIEIVTTDWVFSTG